MPRNRWWNAKEQAVKCQGTGGGMPRNRVPVLFKTMICVTYNQRAGRPVVGVSSPF